MVEVTGKNENGVVTAFVSGRIDFSSAPQFDSALEALDVGQKLILDCEKLEYISSAGLRVLLLAQKTMAKQGEMRVKKANTQASENSCIL